VFEEAEEEINSVQNIFKLNFLVFYMKKMLIVAVSFVAMILALSLVLAVENESVNDKKEIKNMVEKNESKSVSNMTYGKCVVESVGIRKTCFDNSKTSLVSCRNETSANESATKKDCNNSYKSALKACKSDFKNMKLECAKTAKPKFFEKLRYSFV
jgi:hypothetical protein